MTRLAFIQGIRASAALAIIAFHLSDHISRSGYTGRIVTEMMYVVLLFFVISGFVISYTLEQRNKSNLNFYIRRVFRISPLFYSVFLIYILYNVFILKQPLPPIDLTLLTLTYTFNLYPAYAYSYVGAGWIVGVEMLFYILSPLMVYYIDNLNKAIAFFIASVIISYCFIKIMPIFTPPVIIDFYTYAAFPNQLPVFVVGIICYFIYRDIIPKINYKLSASLILGITFLGLMYFAYGHNFFLPNCIRGLAFGCLLISIALNPTKLITNRAFLFLGDISYSIYLIHPLIIFILFPSVYSTIHNIIGTGITAYIMCYIITLILVLPLAYLSYISIEKQGIKIGKKLIMHKQHR